MANQQIKIILSTLVAFFLLNACGGGSSNNNNSSSVPVQLSGVIGVDLPGNTGATEQTARRGSTPQNQVVVMAVDAMGNSFATATDQAGEFKFSSSLGILTNTAYALIFIDMASLEVIATLTTGSGEAAMLTLTGNTVLSEVVIDPEVRLSSIIGAVNSGGDTINLQLIAADAIDSDNDGQITQLEIMNTLVNTVQSGNIDSITSVSAFTFLGNRGTWAISADLEDDAFEDSVCEWIDLDTTPSPPSECLDDDDDNDPEIDFFTDSGEITLMATEQVEGPDGNLIDAVKILEMVYLNTPYANPDSEYVDMINTSLLWDVGYANGSQADINESATSWGTAAGNDDEYWTPYIADSLSAPPTKPYSQRMGLMGWSEYAFPQLEQDQFIFGEKIKDSDEIGFSIEWGGSSLPLNMPLNSTFEFTETETDESIDPVTGETVIETETVTSLVTVRLALNSDGTPALIQEGGSSGILLPVFQIQFAAPLEDENECSYIVARYGVEGDDLDENCEDMSDWQDSLVNLRFGRISKSDNIVSVSDRTPQTIISNDTDETVLPVDSNGELTSAAEQWLVYLYDNATGLDYHFQSLQPADEEDWGNTSEFWAWVKRPEIGSPLTPQPRSTSIDSTVTIFKMGQSPGSISVNDIHYISTDGGVQFYLDLRTSEEGVAAEHSILINPILINTAVDTSVATTTETIVSISATIPALPVANDSKWGNTWSSLENPDGTGAMTYQTARINVWVIMDADADLNTLDDQYEFPIDGYRVIDPASGS